MALPWPEYNEAQTKRRDKGGAQYWEIILVSKSPNGKVVMGKGVSRKRDEAHTNAYNNLLAKIRKNGG